MKMLPTLKSGDVVDIVAPAFGCSAEDVAKSVEFLHSWGLKARVAEGLLGADLLCANADARRAGALFDALTNSESKAVWAIRGGYGSARLLPYLEAKGERGGIKKLFLGFSDITVLHIWLKQNWGWPTLHAPTLLRAAKGEVAVESIESLKALLFGENKKISYAVSPMNKSAESAQITAEIVGGNLSVIASGIGTDWQIDTAGKILFIEEVDERGYRIDRMLTQLQQAGIIAKSEDLAESTTKAVVLGDFSGGEEPDSKSLVLPVLDRFAREVGIPCFRLSGIGHEATNNPLPFGVEATINNNSISMQPV